jgi:hypothetical protein
MVVTLRGRYAILLELMNMTTFLRGPVNQQFIVASKRLSTVNIRPLTRLALSSVKLFFRKKNSMAFYQGHSMTAFFLVNTLLGKWLFVLEPID